MSLEISGLIEKCIKENRSVFPNNINLDDYIKKIISKSCLKLDFLQGELKSLIAYYESEFDEPFFYISFIFVGTRFRGKGVIDELLSQLFELMKYKDIKICRLEVKKSNLRAISAYKNNGFLIKSENDGKIFMEKSLTNT